MQCYFLVTALHISLYKLDSRYDRVLNISIFTHSNTHRPVQDSEKKTPCNVRARTNDSRLYFRKKSLKTSSHRKYYYFFSGALVLVYFQ